jgi:hypothetical protein
LNIEVLSSAQSLVAQTYTPNDYIISKVQASNLFAWGLVKLSPIFAWDPCLSQGLDAMQSTNHSLGQSEDFPSLGAPHD